LCEVASEASGKQNRREPPRIRQNAFGILPNVYASSEVFIPTLQDKLLISDNTWFITLRPCLPAGRQTFIGLRDENLGEGIFQLLEYKSEKFLNQICVVR